MAKMHVHNTDIAAVKVQNGKRLSQEGIISLAQVSSKMICVYAQCIDYYHS